MFEGPFDVERVESVVVDVDAARQVERNGAALISGAFEARGERFFVAGNAIFENDDVVIGRGERVLRAIVKVAGRVARIPPGPMIIF